jgi:hypothetical protein
MEFIASHHAAIRQQQRGIPGYVIDSLINYGKVNHDHHGAEILTLPKAVRQKLKNAKSKGKYNALESHFDCNAALNESVIVTVGHRTKCMKGLDL